MSHKGRGEETNEKDSGKARQCVVDLRVETTVLYRSNSLFIRRRIFPFSRLIL
jgi:hypothetical protein